MDSGMWMSMHVMEDPVTVALGTSGSVDLQQAEDNTWWIGEMAFASGDVHPADNGNEYMLTYDMDSGMWMSMHVMAAPVTVALGTSGSVDLQQAEDNSWWIGEMAFASGDVHPADNGNEYMLTYDMETGMWSSQFQPMSMEITGTGLMAMSREDQAGYDVGEDMLSASGDSGAT
jgi:hypothetical protein